MRCLEHPPGEKIEVLAVLADKRLEQPLGTIVLEYGRTMKRQITMHFFVASEVDALVKKADDRFDVVFCMPETANNRTEVERLPGAEKVAWKYPSGEPVWAAVLTQAGAGGAFVDFAGGRQVIACGPSRRQGSRSYRIRQPMPTNGSPSTESSIPTP